MKKNLFKLFTFLLLIICNTPIYAQIEDPVSWSCRADSISGENYEIILTASIKEGWHLYSTSLPEGGPQPTKFTFIPTQCYQLLGNVKEVIKPNENYDEVFDMAVTYFAEEAIFSQTVQLAKCQSIIIKGRIEYQACIEEKCVFLEKEFSVEVGLAKKEVVDKKVETKTKVVPMVQSVAIVDKNVYNNSDKGVQKSSIPSIKADTVVKKTKSLDSKAKESNSLWVFFFISFLSGLLAILTPCVFPMIPMTVSFFMHGGKSKTKAKVEALFYGFSIVFIYTILGTLVAFTLGPSFANFLSTHWLPNVMFFLIFLIFAFSFFGMFEIVMPSWVVNKADKQVDKGGIWGPFFMAFTLVLVSFSCTGPIVGAVLVQSAGGAFLKPIVGMLGFSLAFALPFTLFAFFPSWLSNLPRSGGWLNTVKVVLGFIELALGLKFLSMADLTYHWHLLDREVYLAFWVVLAFLLGFYLLGKLRFAHDDEVTRIGVPRLILAIFAFTFGIYMIPGFWGAPLKALSGYIPPMTTQDFDMTRIIEENTENISSNYNEISIEKPLYGDFLKLPYGIKGYFDWDQALACSKAQGKPIFVDFTGHGCANCRKMEENVWVNPEVLKRLKEDYIVLSLYVDDKTELPESAWITTPEGSVKKTIGAKNSYIQQTRFAANSQPQYVILDGNGDQIMDSRFFDLNIEGFIQYLDNGIKSLRKNTP